MRRTGGVIAATSRPWYLRVLRLGTVDDAYPPSALVASHSRPSSLKRTNPDCTAVTGVRKTFRLER
jgi:hypothetical protein